MIITTERKLDLSQLLRIAVLSIIPTLMCALATAICILSRSLFTL